MKHSQILEEVESLIAQPLRIYAVERVNTVSLTKAEDQPTGDTLAAGEYAVVELRLMLPLKAG